MAEGTRALDVRVAEEVMGWQAAYLLDGNVFAPRVHDGALEDLDYFETPDRGRMPCGWSPTTCAAEDYEVLEHVRETWGHSQRYVFGIELVGLWRKRTVESKDALVMRYRPGDYSRAALAVLDREVANG